MQYLTDRERDVIQAKAKILEQAMWDVAKDNSYVYKPKFSISNLMDQHPRLMMISLTPLSFILVAIVAEIVK